MLKRVIVAGLKLAYIAGLSAAIAYQAYLAFVLHTFGYEPLGLLAVISLIGSVHAIVATIES